MFGKTSAGLAALILSLATIGAAAQSAEEGTPKMKDLESVDELKAKFNEDAGKRRLLLLLSPT